MASAAPTVPTIQVHSGDLGKCLRPQIGVAGEEFPHWDGFEIQQIAILYSAHRGFEKGSGAAGAVQDHALTPRQTYDLAYPAIHKSHPTHPAFSKDERTAAGSVLITGVTTATLDDAFSVPVLVAAVQAPDNRTGAYRAEDSFLNKLFESYYNALKGIFDDAVESNKNTLVQMSLLGTGVFRGTGLTEADAVNLSVQALQEATQKLRADDPTFDNRVHINIIEFNAGTKALIDTAIAPDAVRLRDNAALTRLITAAGGDAKVIRHSNSQVEIERLDLLTKYSSDSCLFFRSHTDEAKRALSEPAPHGYLTCGLFNPTGIVAPGGHSDTILAKQAFLEARAPTPA